MASAVLHPCERCRKVKTTYRLCDACAWACKPCADASHHPDCPHYIGWTEQPCACAAVMAHHYA